MAADPASRRHVPRRAVVPLALARMVLAGMVLAGMAFAALVLSGCAHTSKQGPDPVAVTNTARFTLLGPEHIDRPMDMVQQIRGQYGGRELLLEALVRADEQGLEMEFFNELGATLGFFSYSGGRPVFESVVFPASFKPEYLAADFQFCFYDPAALIPALGKLRLEIETKDGMERRRILEGKIPIIEIEKTSDMVRYVNHLRGYSYTILGDFL